MNKIVDIGNINHSKKTIIQASDLKQKLESLKIIKKNVTVISLNIKAMYPSMTFNMVAKAINLLSRKFKIEKKEIIEDCLRMIKFGMGNTLLNFAGKYYKYGDSIDISQQGLTIGCYKSACHADLVASYLLGNSTKLFKKTSTYHGISIETTLLTSLMEIGLRMTYTNDYKLFKLK